MSLASLWSQWRDFRRYTIPPAVASMRGCAWCNGVCSRRNLPVVSQVTNIERAQRNARLRAVVRANRPTLETEDALRAIWSEYVEKEQDQISLISLRSQVTQYLRELRTIK